MEADVGRVPRSSTHPARTQPLYKLSNIKTPNDHPISHQKTS